MTVRPGSPARRLAVGAVLLVAGSALALLLLESCVRLGDLARRQRDAAEQATAPPVDGARPLSNVQLHPFLGYAQRPGTNPRVMVEIDELGELTEEEFVLAILGGSVAAELAREGGEILVAELERLRSKLAGSIRLLDLGMGGYKQPQQLILLSMLLALDTPIDVAVNIDGFNEVALSAGNAKFEVHPIFPHHAQLARVYEVAAGSASMTEVELTAAVLSSTRRAEAVRAFLDRHPWLRRLETTKALFGIAITSAEDRAVAAERRLAEAAQRAHAPAIANLDDPCLGDEFGCHHLVTRIWRRSSLMMEAVAARQGVVYLHLLQPNQYVPGSKELSAEELRTAYTPETRWSRAVAMFYGDLSRAGLELREAGVDFHDLTLLYRDRRDTIYDDPCCHYNALGYRLLAERLAELLDAALERRDG